jgi:hypothetical protein
LNSRAAETRGGPLASAWADAVAGVGAAAVFAHPAATHIALPDSGDRSVGRTRLTDATVRVAERHAKATKALETAAATAVRLLPIRPRSRGARRSLRTFPVVTLHPRFPFNVRLTGKTFD